MNGAARPSVWLVSSILILTNPGAFAAASADTPNADQAHRLTLQILGGLASCGDRSGGPEYYATASRDDPDVERELKAVRRERASLRPRIEAFDERIEPLELREHNTVPLTADEQRELDELRARNVVIQQQLGDSTLELSSEQRAALTREQSELDKSVERLEHIIPLSDDEVRYLRDQRNQRAPLADRQRTLGTQERDLLDLTYMSTPGSLTVYPNDVLRTRLMEDDAFEDDTCATWDVTLSPEILKAGGLELGASGRPLLKLWVRRVSP